MVYLTKLLTKVKVKFYIFYQEDGAMAPKHDLETSDWPF